MNPLQNNQPIPLTKGLKPEAIRVDQRQKSTPARGADAKEMARLKQACQDFESIFLNQMLSKMREANPKSDLFGSDRGEELYRGMLDEQLAKQMAAGGGVGLARTLCAQLAEQVAGRPHDASAPVTGLKAGPASGPGEAPPEG